MSDWQLFWRDGDHNLVAAIDVFDSFETTILLNDAGGWVLRLPADALAASRMRLERGISGVVLKRGAAVVMSGPAEHVKLIEHPDGNVLEIEGVSEIGIVARYLAWPQPFNLPNQEADVFTDVAENAIRHYIGGNMGASAWEYRRYPNLDMGPYSGHGLEVTGRARWDNLLELCQSLALKGGVRFDLRQKSDSAGLIFTCGVPADKSGEVVFSPQMGNVTEATLEQATPTANWVIVGGEGEGTDRVVADGGDNESIAAHGRRELFVDQRDASDPVELAEAIAAALSNGGEMFGVQIAPIDTQPWTFPDDYDVGVRVSVYVGGVTQVAYVTAVNLALKGSGDVQISPEIAALPIAGLAPDQAIERATSRRIGHIERNGEMMTVAAISDAQASTFAPFQHDNANHSTDFAPTPHDNSHHSVDLATQSELDAAISGHDTEHDDRFSQLGHTHTVLPSVAHVTGIYTGDGTTASGGRQIPTGFGCSLVIIIGGTTTGTLQQYLLNTVNGGSFNDNAGNITFTSHAHIDASDGFVVGDGAGDGANVSGRSYTYIAFR